MTIYLVRHGSAGSRRDGHAGDPARPLDAVGVEQAAAIARHLAAVDPPVTVVRSSPATRCVETVEPLGTALGVAVEGDPTLFEGTDVEVAWDTVEGLARDGVTAVLCSHGDVIPELIHRARLRGMDTGTASGCKKGSIWALEWDGERFTRGAYVASVAVTITPR